MGVDMCLPGKLVSNGHKTHLPSSKLFSWDTQEATLNLMINNPWLNSTNLSIEIGPNDDSIGSPGHCSQVSRTRRTQTIKPNPETCPKPYCETQNELSASRETVKSLTFWTVLSLSSPLSPLGPVQSPKMGKMTLDPLVVQSNAFKQLWTAWFV